MYEYNARVVRVVDGDTVELDIDLGFKVFHRVTVRLSYINAPEMNTPEGKVSKMYVMERLPVGSSVVIKTQKDKQEKYGRYLAEIFIGDESLNSTMLAKNLATVYN